MALTAWPCGFSGRVLRRPMPFGPLSCRGPVPRRPTLQEPLRGAVPRAFCQVMYQAGRQPAEDVCECALPRRHDAKPVVGKPLQESTRDPRGIDGVDLLFCLEHFGGFRAVFCHQPWGARMRGTEHGHAHPIRFHFAP
jgi:hypothetical protein